MLGQELMALCHWSSAFRRTSGPDAMLARMEIRQGDGGASFGAAYRVGAPVVAWEGGA